LIIDPLLPSSIEKGIVGGVSKSFSFHDFILLIVIKLWE
jgi:hypothetical protein